MRSGHRSLRTALRTVIVAAVLALVASSCALGTEGLIVTSAAVEEVDPFAVWGDAAIEIELPRIAPIALPDLSGFGEYDELLQDRLGSLSLQPIDGVEVATVACDQGVPLLQGDHTHDVFGDVELGRTEFTFAIDPDTGSSSYLSENRGLRTAIETQPDGSGVLVEQASDYHLSIQAELSGGGQYYLQDGPTITSVEADANGAGLYFQEEEDSLETITINADQSGQWHLNTGDRLVTIDTPGDGSGELYIEVADKVTTLRVRGDGSWEFDESSREDEVNVKVLADGSGQYRQRGEIGVISLDFDADGTSHWRGKPGPQVILPEVPRFVVADRFPPLGTLATFSPPCATVLRFDSAVLFEVGKSDVLPAAAAVLAEVAPTLIDAGRSIEVNGHTDATGSDEYNQDLSQQRAQAVAEELQALGVDVEMTITGHGERQPVAPNYNEDGSDNEAGQRSNRRVEIVIHD